MAHTELLCIPYGERLWMIHEPCHIAFHTDEGVLSYTADAGFVTDFRSPRGVLGDIVDIFVPNTGNENMACCFLAHDIGYTWTLDGEHVVSRAVADELLYLSLKYSGMSDAKAMLVWETVRAFGESPYEQPTEWCNGAKFDFEWSAK